MDETVNSLESNRRLVAWAAILVPVIGWSCLASFLVATDGDLTVVFRPEQFLALDSSSISLFKLGLVLDVFGYYLTFFIIGPYFRDLLRPRQGQIIDMAHACLIAYVLLGIIGAAMQLTTVTPLANLWAGSDPIVRTTSEVNWMSVATMAQNGIWGMEGPVMAFWGWVVGKGLRASGVRYGTLLMASGLAYGAFFVAIAVGSAEAASGIQTVAIILLPVWALLTGIDLLRKAPGNG